MFFREISWIGLTCGTRSTKSHEKSQNSGHFSLMRFVQNFFKPVSHRLGNSAAINDHNLTIHKAIAIANHECSVLGQFFGPALATG